MKAFADGSLGSSTAWFFDPYTDKPDSYGLPMDIMTDGSLEKWAIECDKNKLQLSVHAIGDRAISEVLDVFEKIISVNPVWDRRFRIEHAQHMSKDDFERCRKLGVIVSAQPYHLYDDGGWAVDKIGVDRMKRTFAFKSFIDAGVTMTFGSDWSVAPLNPMTGIYAALTRETSDGKYPDGLIPEEKITIEDAIKCYTINGAYAAYNEHKLGSIEAGKFADMVVLSENILDIPARQIIDVQADMTIFDGEIIYIHH
jgi:predicted amidohydrolase YtcJ